MLTYIYKVIPGILDYDVLPEEIPVLSGNLENSALLMKRMQATSLFYVK
jgi:hypothetical protein